MSVLERNNVREVGDGSRIMIFAHGFGCDQNMWRFVAPAFEPDFRTVLFDHVGAGRSDLSAYNPAKYVSLQGYAGNVVEIAGGNEIHCSGHLPVEVDHSPRRSVRMAMKPNYRYERSQRDKAKAAKKEAKLAAKAVKEKH